MRPRQPVHEIGQDIAERQGLAAGTATMDAHADTCRGCHNPGSREESHDIEVITYIQIHILYGYIYCIDTYICCMYIIHHHTEVPDTMAIQGIWEPNLGGTVSCHEGLSWTLVRTIT